VKEERAQGGKQRIDLLGAVLVTGGLIAVVDGLLAAARAAWSDGSVLVPLLSGFVALLAFLVVEMRTKEPLLPLRLIRVMANLSTIFLNSAMVAMFFLVTLYMQNVLGYTPLVAGLAYLPFCAAMIPGLFISTWLTARAGMKASLAIGFAISASGMLLLSDLPVSGSYVASLLPALIVLALGFGVALPTLQGAALHGISEHDAGLASGIQTAVQALGASLGLAVLVTIGLRRQHDLLVTGVLPLRAATGGNQLAFLAGCAILVVGMFSTLLFVPHVQKSV
jgi:hypothetical protein